MLSAEVIKVEHVLRHYRNQQTLPHIMVEFVSTWWHMSLQSFRRIHEPRVNLKQIIHHLVLLGFHFIVVDIAEVMQITDREEWVAHTFQQSPVSSVQPIRRWT